MKKLIVASVMFFSLFALTTVSHAITSNQTVTKIVIYSSSVYASVYTSNGCGGNPATPFYFDHTTTIGKAVYTMVLSAFLSGKQVDINDVSCALVDAYL